MTTFMTLFVSSVLKRALLYLRANLSKISSYSVDTAETVFNLGYSSTATQSFCAESAAIIFLLSQIYLSRELVCRAAARTSGKEGLPIINSPFGLRARLSRVRIQSASISFRAKLLGLSRGAASQLRLSQWIQRLAVFTAFSHPHFIRAVAYTASSRWGRGHRHD